MRKSMKSLFVMAVIASVLSFSGFSEAGIPETREEKEDYDFANGLLSRGMYDTAAESYKDFLKKYPQSAYLDDARYRMAESYFLQNDNEKALAEFSLFLKEKPSSKLSQDAKLRIGQIYFAFGDMEKAEEMLEEVLRTEGVSGETAETAEYYLADIMLKSGEKREAREAFEDLLGKYDKGAYSGFAGLRLGDIYSEEKEFEKAAEVYTETAQRIDDPEMAAEANLRAAEAFVFAGRAENALTKYREVLSAAENEEIKDRASLGIASALFKEERSPEAIEEIKALLPGVKSEDVKYRMKFILANSYLNGNSFDLAKKTYDEIVKNSPDKNIVKRARLNNCWALYKLEEHENCIKEAEAYIKDIPDEDVDEALYVKGKALSATGFLDEAIEIYDSIISGYVDSLFRREVLYDKGWAYYQKGEISEGTKAHKIFVSEFPDDERSPGVLLKIGQEALKNGEYEEAITVYKKFLEEYEKDPQRQFAMYQKARAFYEAERYDEAIEVYDLILEDFPYSEITGNVFYWRAISHQKKENWDKAIQDFRQAANKGGELAVKASEAVAFSLFQKGEEAAAADAYYAVISESIGAHAGIKKEIYLWTAEFYTEKKESEKALEVIGALEKSYPGGEDKDVLYLLGENSRIQEKREDAIKYFTMALEKGVASPRKERCYLGIGRAYAASGDKEKAVEALGKALSGDRDNVTGALARVEIGDIYARDNDFAEAAKQYAMVGILYEDNEIVPNALFQAAVCFKKAGQLKEAKKLFAELTARYPENPLATKAKEELAGTNGPNTR